MQSRMWIPSTWSKIREPINCSNSETGCNNWLTCDQRPLNDPEIDGGSTTH